MIRTSKGGFYHHFISKDAVLKTICEQRARQAAERCAQALEGVPAPLERLNLLLRQAIPLQKEELPFMNMLLPTLGKSECAAVRVGYQDALTQSFHDLLAGEISRATQAGVLHPVVSDPAGPVLLLLNQAWYDACLYLLRCVRKEERYESATILNLLQQTRRCVEVLLEAPYGGIQLADLQTWDEAAQYMMMRLSGI